LILLRILLVYPELLLDIVLQKKHIIYSVEHGCPVRSNTTLSFFTIVCILLRISLLLTYVTVYAHFSCLLSYFPHYMFRPQRVIFRCSTYITLPLYCAHTHFFLFEVATSMYIQPPTCSILPMALFHALWSTYHKMLKYFKIYTNMFNKTVIKHRLKFVS
jgi:hypothetical protein